jgi:feruloyl esterase
MAFLPDAGPRWSPKDFNFDEDYKRAGVTEALYDASNPDLRAFKRAGAKLLIAQGWHDSGTPLPLSTVDYYETVERTMGGRENTQDFARLFMIPGKAHCLGGPGANAIDYLHALESWVEHGQAPDMLVAAHVESDEPAAFLRLPGDLRMAKFTRPIYPYPVRARYRGTGDPNDYRNFLPVDADIPTGAGVDTPK